MLPTEQAWKLLFWMGIVPALLILYVRRNVQEPSVYLATKQAARDTGVKTSFLQIFHPRFLATTILASLLATGMQGAYYAVTTWLPTFLKVERKLTVVGSTGYLAMLIAGSFVGYLVGAWMADRMGRRKLFITFSIGAIVLILLYTQMDIGNDAMLWLGFPLGFFASGYFSGMGAFLTELFPTRLRGSGQGFTYNFGRGIGALFPALVGFASAQMSLSSAIAIFAVVAYGLFLVAALLLPETRGRVLQA